MDLIALLNLVVRKLRALAMSSDIQALLDGTISTAAYAAFLSHAGLYVAMTTSLLARAAEQMSRLGHNPEIARRLAQKADVEAGHADWALNDLERSQ